KYNIDEFYSSYFFVENGYNLRPTEITGFLANNQLQYLDKIVEEREKNFMRAVDLFSRNPELYSPNFNGMDVVSSFAIPFMCKNKKTKDEFLLKCKENNIETRPMIAGSIANHPFLNGFEWEQQELVNANFIHDNYFYIGNHESFKDAEHQELKNLIL
ncbi:DegT/DnrJ/EryC1/StrS family aminotransferase, partial [Alphaproteobacteria bacterium]|nr:DegT/DnrJ/EryC1/StrS family aminotransferase [Alphaproteobacteria bacterium]